jgi:hypothetical protein
MKNAIVYSFVLRSGNIKDLYCYKQLKYSIDTLRKYNQDIPVYIYIAGADLSNLAFDKNVYIVKFDVIDDGGWPNDLVKLGYLEFSKPMWENAIQSIHDYGLDNILYLDTDTVFHNDPEILFNKYGSTEYLWAKPDNSADIMRIVEVWPGMNDGQFILSKALANKDILSHMKFYVNHITSKHKDKLTNQQYKDLCWISTQYAVWDYFQNQKNPVRYFDDKEVMLHVEPEHNNTDNLILHHYYTGNTAKFVPKKYL